MSGKTKIIIATSLFTLGPFFVKIIPLDGITILWSISLISVILLTIKIIFQKRTKELLSLDRKNFQTLIFLGVISTANNSLYNLSIKATTISNAVLTHYLAPIFLLFLGFIFFREKIEKTSILALLISLAGLVLILFPQELTFKNSHFAGLLLGTASAVLFASEIIAKKKLALKHKGDVVTVWFFSLSILLLVFFASPESVSEMNIQNWLTLLVYGIITSTGISLFISGTKETKAQHIGVLSYLEPLGAIIWGILLLSEGLTIFTFLGGTMILSSGYLIIRQNPVPKKYAVN